MEVVRSCTLFQKSYLWLFCASQENGSTFSHCHSPLKMLFYLVLVYRGSKFIFENCIFLHQEVHYCQNILTIFFTKQNHRSKYMMLIGQGMWLEFKIVKSKNINNKINHSYCAIPIRNNHGIVIWFGWKQKADEKRGSIKILKY